MQYNERRKLAHAGFEPANLRCNNSSKFIDDIKPGPLCNSGWFFQMDLFGIPNCFPNQIDDWSLKV